MANDFKLNLKAEVDIDNIKKQLREIGKTTKVKIGTDGVAKTTQEITKLKGESGETVRILEKFGEKGKTVDATFSKVSQEISKTSSAVSKATKEISKTSDTVETLGNKFDSMGKKIQSINGIFQAVKNVVVNFGQAIEPLLEFEDSLTEFKKVSDLSGEALDEYTKKLGQMGQEVGKSRAEMVDAATEFKKSGFDEADSAQLARIASLYQNIADEELSAGEEANFIISQMKAFNLTADDAMHIIDSVNEV